MQQFAHAGDLGDIIYSLPTIRALGGGVLRLRPAGYTDKPMTQERADLLIPLIEKQPYIERVYFDASPHEVPGEVNLDRFRAHLGAGNLVGSHAEACGIKLDHWSPEPWIEGFQAYTDHGWHAAINVTARYHNPWFPWDHITGNEDTFIGTEAEYKAFRSRVTATPPWSITPNFAVVADIIASSRCFVGNQSSPYAVAVGMGHPAILAVSPQVPNCLFHRSNIQNYFMGELFVDRLL